MSRMHFPSLQRGGCARKKNSAKPPQQGADGVVRKGTSVSRRTTPAAPFTRMPAAAFFLVARPPLLCKEGNE